MKRTLKDLSDKELLVFNCLNSLCQKRQDGIAFISYSAIAQKTGLKYEYVSSVLRYLIKDNLIERFKYFNETGGCKTNGYKIVM